MSESRFQGDMDRNEVEMDLNKFMAMIQEISELKDKIRDLEADKNVNPHQKWIHLARAVDAWRIFPRVFLSVYIFLLYYSLGSAYTQAPQTNLRSLKAKNNGTSSELDCQSWSTHSKWFDNGIFHFFNNETAYG